MIYIISLWLDNSLYTSSLKEEPFAVLIFEGYGT